MSLLFSNNGGSIVLPEKLLCDRLHGGHLIVNPPRPVWERSCLTADELVHWSLLVAATGQAMLEVLPTLSNGCLNYWEAGNWALNEQAHPVGPKDPKAHRRVHLHLLGRNRNVSDSHWAWGESPIFSSFAESDHRSSQFVPLSQSETRDIVEQVNQILPDRYKSLAAHFPPP